MPYFVPFLFLMIYGIGLNMIIYVAIIYEKLVTDKVMQEKHWKANHRKFNRLYCRYLCYIVFSKLLAFTYFNCSQKFRAGGYNVIVATSIGEEGLDIMEVDLVVCFDANVSPLRMIQRMGRTGRKHDGRVDILCHFHFHFHSEDCRTVCFYSSLRSFQFDPWQSFTSFSLWRVWVEGLHAKASKQQGNKEAYA